MKRKINIYVILLIIAALVFSFLTIYAFGHEDKKALSLSASSAVLYLPETGEFIYSKNADSKLPMASTTKIMTALVALENSELSETVVIDERAAGTEGSSAYLKAGEELTMEELLYALLLQSANDAAVAIACHLGGDLSGFSEMMNEKAIKLGLENTHFTNPHGLDDNEHYTTARELALIAAEALKNDCFRDIVSTYKKTFSNDERSRTYVNHNKLLKLYDGCIGVKTGFTKKSGRCLVAAAERDGLTFISVTLDAPNDWNDHSILLDSGYARLEKIVLADVGEYRYSIPLINGENDSFTVSNTSNTSVITAKSEQEIQSHIKLVKYAVAPITKGEILGEIIFTQDGKEIGRTNLVAEETVLKSKDKNLIDIIFSLFN